MGMNDSDPIEERDILKLLSMLEEERIQKKLKEVCSQWFNPVSVQKPKGKSDAS